MDISGLNSVTTPAEMITWLTENCVTPIQPGMSGTDFGIIMQKILNVTGVTNAQFAAYLQNLPGYVGDGSKILADDLTWQGSGETTLDTPVLTLGDTSSNNIPTSWATIANASIYMLQRALDSAFTNALTNVYSGTALSFNDTGLAFDTQYYYRAKATAAGFNDSLWSAVQSQFTGLASGQTANINLGNTGFTASEPGWVNFMLADWATSENGWNSGTSPEINNNAGVPTGWKINFSPLSGLGSGPVAMHGVSAPDFPNDVTDYHWINQEQSPFYALTMAISGLNPSNAYNIKTVHFDTVSLGIEMNWGSLNYAGDQGGNSGTTPLEIIAYPVAADSNGNVSGQLFSTVTGSAVINGIIITEIPITNKYANIGVGTDSSFYQGWNVLPNNPLNQTNSLASILNAPLNWDVTVSSDGSLGYEQIASTIASDDFPQNIRNQQWFMNSGTYFTFTFSGLDTTKNYSIKTCHSDSGYTGNGTTAVSCNNSPVQSGDPDNNTFFLIFANIAPDSSGNIAVTLTSPNGAPLINAMIISEQ